MRKSPLRHTLAILRTKIGLTQKELANLAGCSWPTIQSIELGKRRLTESMAARISLETGIDVGWLLADNPKDRPKDEGGIDFGRAVYEQHRADVEFGHEELAPLVAEGCLVYCIGLVAAIILRAHALNQCNLYIYKVQKGMKAIAAEIGVHEDQNLHPSVEPIHSIADETVREFTRRFETIVQRRAQERKARKRR